MSNTTPPGWFPDPQVPGQQRYWDGNTWTEHTAPYHHPVQSHPAVTAQPLAPAAARGNWFLRHPILSGVAALFVVLIAIGAASGGGDPDSDDKKAVASDSKSNDAVEPADDAPTDSPSAVVEAAPVDTDGDGAVDSDDFMPNDANVQTAYDVDTDGDGVADPDDDFPEDAAFSKDSDGDQVADRLDAFPQDANYSKDTDSDQVADSVDAFPNDPSRSEITLAMENALGSAENYLDLTGFSRQGLIDQLTSEYGDGYKVADATWAVDQLDANWKEQAVRSAKGYLDFTSFSRQGLIDQLSSAYGDQYTLEEATYAVDKIGL